MPESLGLQNCQRKIGGDLALQDLRLPLAKVFDQPDMRVFERLAVITAWWRSRETSPGVAQWQHISRDSPWAFWRRNGNEVVIRQHPIQSILIAADRTGIAPVLEHKQTLRVCPVLRQPADSCPSSFRVSSYHVGICLPPSCTGGLAAFGIRISIQRCTDLLFQLMGGMIPRRRCLASLRIRLKIAGVTGLNFFWVRCGIFVSTGLAFLRMQSRMLPPTGITTLFAPWVFSINCLSQRTKCIQRLFFATFRILTDLGRHEDAPYPGKDVNQVPSWDKHDELSSRCPRYLATKSIA